MSDTEPLATKEVAEVYENLGDRAKQDISRQVKRAAERDQRQAEREKRNTERQAQREERQTITKSE